MTDAPPPSPLRARRIERHREIEAGLRGLSDEEVARWLAGTALLDDGHAAATLPGGGARVFVKLVALTAFELRPEHRESTANLFGLPAYYQYRLGGLGFGAWRELEVHRIANEWVLSGQCPRFALLHDWRVLPIVSRARDDRHSAKHWGNDAAIARRVSAFEGATSSAVLFLEYFPQTLLQWLRDRLPDTANRVALVRDTDAALLELLAFMNGQGVLHMDAHFENILTDGSGLFLADHGLAISRTFPCEADELEFFERHQNFDRCTAITSLVHAVVTHYDASEDWRQTLRDLIDGRHAAAEALPAAMRSFLALRGPVALAIGAFYRRLLEDLTTEYPGSSLESLLDA